MGRICSITAAIVLLTVSWVCAGTFEVLARAEAYRASTPLQAAHATLVKAQFKSQADADSEIRTESDSMPNQPAMAGSRPLVRPQPVVAYKKGSVRPMAPPPKAAPVQEPAYGAMAQSDDKADSLELDLEKDLVISPPPAQLEEKPEQLTRPSGDSAPRQAPSVTSREPRMETKAKATAKRPALPPETQYASNIRKVRPLSSNAWCAPAGSHGTRNVPRPAAVERGGADDYSRMTPPTVQRFVRDGVTVKLAQPQAPQAYPESAEEQDRSDIVSAAVELIGMPFAFISSLF